MEDPAELLIIEVQKNDCLYEKRHPLFKDKLKKTAIWKTIGTRVPRAVARFDVPKLLLPVLLFILLYSNSTSRYSSSSSLSAIVFRISCMVYQVYTRFLWATYKPHFPLPIETHVFPYTH